ncbi:MAG: zf-HC2 domain-containing protein [Roseburia sp.]|nr:zf-HC2 domain-containing protein [Roseburia sp.]MCM1279659.1 zf-HC2 domain-containing protein [Robinsoniella sp.]
MKENVKKQKKIELTCNIVGDLLPLYYDEVVSEETKQAVSGHIATCQKCQKEYDLLKEKLPQETGNGQMTQDEERIKGFLQKIQKRGILRGVFIASIVAAFLAGAGYLMTEIPIIRVPSQNASVKYVFEEEGNYFIVLETLNYKCPTACTTDYEKEGGSVSLNYKVPLIHPLSNNDSETENKMYKNIISLDKEELEEVGCKLERIFYNGKEIYQSKDAENQKEAPEYVKVYYEYRDLGDGIVMDFDENTIRLGIQEDVDDNGSRVTGYKMWDWEGNLLYDEEK